MKRPHKALMSVVAALLAVLLLVVPAAQAQSVVLTWVDRAGKVIEQVGTPGPIRGVDLSPDGKKIAAHRHGGQAGDNVIFDAAGTGMGTRLSGDSSIENTPAIWSPDGTRVVYGSKRNDKGGIYIKRTDNQGADDLVFESETTKIPLSWSPDGKFVVYWEPAGVDWILPITGDRKPFQLSETNTLHAQISPNGKWIAYQSNETGRMEIYIKSFPPGPDTWRVSKEGGEWARWRGDSGELYYLSQQNGGKVMASEIRVTGSAIQASAPQALFDSEYTNFNHPNGGIYHTYAVSNDGQRFLIPRPDRPVNASTDNFDRNARTLLLFDREGTVVGAVGDRALYNQASLSPDRTRVAVMKNDPEKGIPDIWVLDIATGRTTRVTSSKQGEAPGLFLWSPDGKQLAYISSRSGTQSIYRKAANGEGDEELLVKLTGAGLQLRDWSSDGRFLTYYSQQLGGNVLFTVPLEGERTPIAALRSQFPMEAAAISPNGRFVAYRSDESGRDEIYVQPFNSSGTSNTMRWKVSPEGGVGPLYWRGDGKELYFVGLTDRSIQAVEVNTESDFQFGKPKSLFKAPATLPTTGLGVSANVSRDGERFLLVVPPAPSAPPPSPPKQQISVFDREGKLVKTIGDPARYDEATLSPDGTRLAVLKPPPPNGGNDSELWTYNVATGEGRSIGKGNIFALLWSPDSTKVFYVSNRPGGINVLCRRAGDGSGSEEELFRQTAGYPLNISDISSDGKFLSLDVGGVIALLPLTGNASQPRQLIEFSREEYFTGNGRFSENGRFLAFVSSETGRSEIYARAVDANGAPSTAKWKVTPDGVANTSTWKADNSELYYYKNDFGDTLVMAVDISTTPAFKAGTPRFLFRVPNVGTRSRNISRDGQRFAFITTVPATTPAK